MAELKRDADPCDHSSYVAGFNLFVVFSVLLMAVWLTPRVVPGAAPTRQSLSVDLSQYDPKAGVNVKLDGDEFHLQWPIDRGEVGHVQLHLGAAGPLIRSLALSAGGEAPRAHLLENVDPVTNLTVGSRGQFETQGWTVFFDKVHQRPYHTYTSKLNLSRVHVISRGRRTMVSLEELAIGPFRGQLCFTLYPHSRLVHVEAVVSTQRDGLAILYDTGLVSPSPSWQRIGWMDTNGRLQSESIKPGTPARPQAVRHRTIVAESNNGAVAIFPPPHQYFYPLDFSTNLKFTWFGAGLHGQTDQYGFGIRQHPEGDNRFVPWFNAPPGTQQRLGVFYLLSRGTTQDALEEVLRYTRGDRFAPLPGHLTFTSHYHVAHTMDVMRKRAEGQDVSLVPPFVSVMKEMGVNIVHLAEFHGDGDPRDGGPKRLPQLELMYRECERLSDARFLLLPGEEPNVHFGGHWMNLFPRPVYWMMHRQGDQPFVERNNYYGNVYRVGSAQELLEMLQRENGLAWTAHARIKSSRGYPDEHRQSNFYLSDCWLGAAWKAMPADLSRDRLGERVLDLMSDMANWGQKKYAIGEVDVFKIDGTHELYGHMNINYLRLSRLPSFQDGWQPVLDALSEGRFFVTTGEVLLSDLTVGGKPSGQTLKISASRQPELLATIEWTFPLSFAEVISGDGQQVYRERIDLAETEAFGGTMLEVRPDLKSRTWVRFEVWDIAANGAFSQPIWLEHN